MHVFDPFCFLLLNPLRAESKGEKGTKSFKKSKINNETCQVFFPAEAMPACNKTGKSSGIGVGESADYTSGDQFCGNVAFFVPFAGMGGMGGMPMTNASCFHQR